MAKLLMGLIKKKLGRNVLIELEGGSMVKTTTSEFKFGDKVQVAMDWQAGRVRKLYPEKMDITLEPEADWWGTEEHDKSTHSIDLDVDLEPGGISMGHSDTD